MSDYSALNRLAFGCSRLGSVSGLNRKESEALIDYALSRGVRFFDTANIYGQGESEQAVGSALDSWTGRKAMVATKAGYQFSGSAVSIGKNWKSILRPLYHHLSLAKLFAKKIRSAAQRQDFSADALIQSAQNSRSRLGVDRIDHFYLHSPPPDILASLETYDVLAAIRHEGICEQTGVAIVDAWHLQVIPPGVPLDVIQVELNLCTEARIFNLVRDFALSRKVSVIVRQPFARGALLSGESAPQEAQVFRSLAQEAGLPLKGLALRYLVSLPWIDRILVGTTNRGHLNEDIKFISDGVLGKELVDTVAKHTL